jgi:octaprenyl-diphosphate synthase
MLNLLAVHQPVATLLAQQLEQVTLIFERQLASDMSAVNTLCMHVERYRGKMLRPTLVLLCGLAGGTGQEDRGQRSGDRGPQSAVGYQRSATGSIGSANSPQPIAKSPLERLTSDRCPLSEKHRVVAAVVEMIHMATLVHDDVLDEAHMRRQGSTVNHLWGNQTAVILGDYLISNAFHLCSTLGDPAINLALGQVTNTLCEGELVQLHHRDDFSIDEATYLQIVSRKTASLIGECCRLGAALSAAPDSVCRAMQQFGSALGIAFQIQDDLLDLIGDEAVVGKSLGKDLDKGKLTLPIIYYVADASSLERGEALRLLRNRDAPALRARLIEAGAVRRTSRTAHNYVAQAKAQLAHLPYGPGRNLLATLADNVESRAF